MWGSVNGWKSFTRTYTEDKKLQGNEFCQNKLAKSMPLISFPLA